MRNLGLVRYFRALILLAALAAATVAMSGVASAAAAPRCTVVGTPGPDVLHGTARADVICGLGGNDVIRGAAGNDILRGGAGDDRLAGGPGDDLLLGDAGGDILDGGSGRNLLRGGAGSNTCVPEARCAVTSTARASSGNPAASPDPGEPPPAPTFPSPFPPSEPPPCTVGCLPAGPSQDVIPPTFEWLEMTRSVELGNGGGSIDLLVSAWDGSGDIASVTVNIAAPDGSPWSSIALQRSDEFDWHGSIPIAGGTPTGVYSVTSVEVVDAAGNVTTVDHEALSEDWRGDEFSLYEGPDTEPPSIEGLTISPQAVDTSAGPAEIDVSAQVTDSGSGLKQIWVTLLFPNHSPPYTDGTSHPTRLRSGTQADGIQEATFELPRWAYPGDYAISEIQLEDFAGNLVQLGRAELEALGFPLDVEQVGPGDTAPPEIVSASLTPATIPAAGGTVEAFVHVRDDLSGFGQWPDTGFSDVYLGFEWPGDPATTETTGRVQELVSGTPLDGVWRLVTTFGPSAPAGQYPVGYIGAYDLAANGGPVHRGELEARGWHLSFTKLP
jgi:RTX calcium-binding nonapeptide repeat (4 copies)